MKRSKAVVAILALALLAVMLPPGTAEAKVGDTAAAGHVSVDTFYQWAVTGDTASQTVQLDLYNLASGTWTSAGTVSNLGTSSFGHSVAISGAGDRNNPMIIVGAPDVEAVYVYRFNSTTNLLEPLNTIFAPNTTGNSRFGASVDLDSGNLVVGAPGAESTPGAADAQGTAYTWDVTSAGFSDPSTSFTEVTVAGLTAGSELGSVVQVEDDVAWLAAPGFSSDAGQVYGYNVISNLVVETLVNPGATTRFGSSLSVDPSRQLVGSKTGNPRLYSAGVSTEIVLGVNSTLTGDTMDVALEGNLLAVAVDQTASGVATAVEVLTNNGDSPTSFSPFTAPAIGEVREIVLGSGWLHVSVPPVGASPARVSAPMSDPDPAVASKYVPQIGVQQTGFGNYTDLDEATLISLRNARTADSQLVVSINDASGWSPTGFTAYQFIDLAGSAQNSTINGDVIAVSLFDGSSEVAVYERADVNSPFLLNERFFTSRAEAARGLAIDETGRYLAVGYPGSGVVDVYDNAAGGWGADPPAVINPQDQALTGSSTTFGWDLDFGDGSLLIGQPNQASLVLASGAPGLAELWTIDGDTTTFIDTLVPTNTATGDTAGWTVEIEEGIRAVGSPRLNTVQTWRTDQSDELLTDPSPPGSQANWGYAMDLDSGVLAVTDWLGDTATYDVYSTGLTQTGTFQSPDLEPSDLANSSFPVATSQGGVVVGARAEDIQGRDAGAIYVFTAPTSQPPVVARTWPVTVDIDNGTAVVGNPDEDLVHVLRNTGNGWNEVQQLVGVADTAFGAGIALQGDVLIVGSPEHAAGSGLINRYDRNPTGGLFTASASFATNPATAVPGVVDEFGAHIDFAGNSVVVGSPSDVNGSAIVYPLDFTSSDGEVIVADPGGSVTVASFGASVATGFDRFDQEYLWVGAPDEGAGFVYGYAFNDNSGLWQPIDTIEGDATGDRYGAHIAADRFYTLISAPNAAGTDNVELVRWSSQQADRDGLRPAGAAVGGIALNGNVDALALTGNSSVAIRSDNGQSLSSIVGATAADTTNGDSVAIDGDWLITSDVDAAGTDWTQLVELSRISSVGTLPNTPANKNVPDFGSDGAGYGSVVDGGEDIYVVASPGNATRGAPGTIAVRDAATNVVVQTIVAPAVVDGDFRDVYLDGDRLAVLQLHAVGAGAAVGTPGVEILQRVGPGAAFDIPGWQLPIADATSIALDGDRLVVGRAPLDAVQVYDFVGGTWNLTATLTPQFIDTSAAFGADVDLAGDVIMIGTDFPDSTDAGYVTAFSLDPIDGWIENSTRIQGTELVLGDPDDVGTAISFDGNWLVVGAADEDGNGGTFSPSTGFVYIFPHTSDGNVGTAQTLDPASEIGGDNGDAAWGTSVDLRGDVLVAGGPGWENPANSAKSGAIISYRYDSADGAWVANGFDEGTGVPSDGEFGDRFGTSAALAGNPLTAMTAIGGAPGEDASGIDAGASYTFTSPAPFFPAGPPNRLISNSLSSDGFGRHIDIDGTVAVVAEHDGGSAEIYDLVGTAWVFRQRLDNVADSIRDVSLDGDRMVLIDRIGNELMQFELSGSTFVAAGTRSYGGTGVPESVVLDGDDIFIGLANSINNEPLKHELWAGGSVAVPTLVDDVNGHETGWSIAKDANLVFVGARRWDSNAGVAEAGRVYIYDTDTSSWTGTIEADGPGTLFGSDLAVSGGRIAVGYPGGEGPRFGGATTAATGVVEIYTNLTPTGATLEQVVSGSNQDVADSFGSKIDISGNVLIVGSNAAAYDGVRRGQAVAFSYGNGTWSETATFRSDADSTGTDQFGHDVAISGEAVLVGAFQHDNARGTDAGAAYWHFVPQPEVDGKLISEPGSDTIDGESGDGFASAISSDGSRLVVGAPENIDLASLLSLNGGVYVYTAGAAGWEFEQFIENPTGNQEENFGAAVAVEGDTLVVGSPTAGATQQGTAWVIDLAGAQAPVELVPGPGSGITDNSEFGSAVDIDGDTVVVGSPGPVGAAPGVAVTRATIWQNVGSTWQLVGDVADTSSDDQRSGSTVAIDGDLVAVGAPSGGFTPGIGYVDIWRQTTPGAWTALANTRLFGLTGERFGQDVDVQTSNLGDVVVVGVPGGNQASLFTYDDSAGWDAGQALVAPGGVTTTFLGSSVAIDGTIVVTGDSDSQRAVAFENSAYRVWTPLTDFQAADGELFDAFGSTAAVAGGNIVIGAPVDSNGNGTYAGAAYEFEVTPPAAPTAPPVTFDPVFIADLSYELPTSVMPGATSVTVEGVSVASTAAGNGASSGVVAASIGAIDLSAPEAANNQLGDITLGDLGIDVGGLGLDALRQIPLTEFPVDGGWNQYRLCASAISQRSASAQSNCSTSTWMATTRLPHSMSGAPR